MSRKGIKRFSLNFQAAPDTPYYQILKYLALKRAKESHRLIFKAVNAFWSPWANEGDPQPTAYCCLYALDKQIERITADYQLGCRKEVKSKPKEQNLIQYKFQFDLNHPTKQRIYHILSVEPLFTAEEKVLIALKGFWNLSAHLNLGAESTTVKKVFSTCLEDLYQHKKLMIQTFSLNAALVDTTLGETRQVKELIDLSPDNGHSMDWTLNVF